MTLRYIPMSDDEARRIREGGPDAYGNPPEREISDGDGVPCRHCLRNVGAGEPYLIFALRPFSSLQPYAETGPIFLHKTPCKRYEAEEILPPVLASSKDFIVRGYGKNDRIVYGTGAVTPIDDIPAYAASLPCSTLSPA